MVPIPIVFHTSDLPSGVGLPLDTAGQVAAINLYWIFATMFVVHTTDSDVPPAGSSNAMELTNGGGSLNKNDYTIQEEAGWQFNGTGTFASTQNGIAGPWTGTAVLSTNGITMVQPGVSIVQPFLPPSIIGQKLDPSTFTVNGVPETSQTVNMQLNAQTPPG
jgi:hypothetical protein